MSYLNTINSFNQTKFPIGSVGSAFKIPTSPVHDETMSMLSTYSTIGIDMSDAALACTAHQTEYATYAAAEIANLHSKLSVLQAGTFAQDHIARVDALQAGNVLEGSTANPNLHSNSIACSVGSFLHDGFKALRDGVHVMANAIRGVLGGLRDAMSGVVSSIKHLFGGLVTDVKDFFAAMKTAAAPLIAAVKEAIAPLLDGIKDGIKDVINSVKTGIASAVALAKEAFTALKDAAKAAYDEALDLIKTKGFLGFLHLNNPCIKDVMGDVINKSAIDQQALDIAKKTHIMLRMPVNPPKNSNYK